MKRPSLTDLSGASKQDIDEQVAQAVVDALQSDDKTIEIRPASQSSGMGLSRLVLLIAGAIGVAYWMRSSQKPDEIIKSATKETADRTREASQQAAETIQRGSETVAEQVEEESKKASETIQQTGEKAAEKAEEASETVEKAGEEAADKTEEAGESAAEKADESGSGQSSS